MDVEGGLVSRRSTAAAAAVPARSSACHNSGYRTDQLPSLPHSRCFFTFFFLPPLSPPFCSCVDASPRDSLSLSFPTCAPRFFLRRPLLQPPTRITFGALSCILHSERSPFNPPPHLSLPHPTQLLKPYFLFRKKKKERKKNQELKYSSSQPNGALWNPRG